MASKDPERVTRSFVNAIRQITPSYQRHILIFLAKNQPKKFTNIQIAHALNEDRSNIWRFINSIIEDSEGNSMIDKTLVQNEVLYSWKEPDFMIEGFKISEILKVLEALENEAERQKDGTILGRRKKK